MPQKNICKFTQPSLPDTLTVSCFVLETNEQIMAQLHKIRGNRMILITSGAGTFKFDDFSAEFVTGNLFFAFTGERICVENAESVTYIYIDFEGSRADELLRRFSISKANRRFEGFDGLIPMWSESLSRANEQTVDLATESILLYTFSRLTGAIDEKSGLLGRMLEITEESFKDHELSVSEIAKMLSYNPKYISHLFKEKMGVSYSEYLRSLRIKYAITLFDHGIDSIKNVAFLSGFSDPLYFSSVFKKFLGVSPKEFVKRLQKSRYEK